MYNTDGMSPLSGMVSVALRIKFLREFILILPGIYSLLGVAVAQTVTTEPVAQVAPEAAGNSASKGSGSETGSLYGRVVAFKDSPQFSVSKWGSLNTHGLAPLVLPIDLTHDSRTDLLLFDARSGTLTVAVADSDHSFTLQTWGQVLPVKGHTLITTGRINNDSCTDVVIYDGTNIQVGLSDCHERFIFSTWAKIAGLKNILLADLFKKGCQSVVGVSEKLLHIFASDCTSQLLPPQELALPPGKQLVDWQVTDSNADLFEDIVAREFNARLTWIVSYRGEKEGLTIANWRILNAVTEGLVDFHLADIDGDSDRDLVTLDRNSNTVYARLLDERQIALQMGTALARLYPGVPFLPAPPTDVNGDGSVDLLFLGPAGRNWWAIFANGYETRTITVEGTFPDRSDWGAILAGDFDADGLADLARVTATGEVWVAQSQVSQGVAGVTLTLSSGAAVTTGTDGKFEFSQLEPGTYGITPQRSDLGLTPYRRDTTIAPGTRIFVGFLATAPDAAPPYLCYGYVPGRQKIWGQQGACPVGYAFYELQDDRALWGTCCPLPAKDILTTDRIEVTGECPDGYVLTGRDETCSECSLQQVYCNKINTDRYMLGASVPAKYWGVGYSSRKEDNRIDKRDIPIGISHAIGRQNFHQWDIDGCIGQPFGALATAKKGTNCAAILFRQLQYRGAAGDPPAGTAVPMFPACYSIDDVFSEHATCDGAP